MAEGRAGVDSWRRFVGAAAPLVAILSSVCALAGVTLVGSCVLVETRALGRAHAAAVSIRTGMAESEVVQLARSTADRVDVYDVVPGWRTRRVVAAFKRLGGEYFVVACLDESRHVAEVSGPMEYPDACFIGPRNST